MTKGPRVDCDPNGENSSTEVGELHEIMQKLLAEVGTSTDEVSNLKKLDQVVDEVQQHMGTSEEK